MKNMLLFCAVLVTTFAIGQNAPIDFETGGQGADWTWAVFENASNPPLEIIANPDPSGINTSATVAKFTALQEGNPWAGCESLHGDTDLGPFVLDETNNQIKIMVWKSVISDVGIKLVSSEGWAQPEIKVANTLVNQWEEITFDFSEYINPPDPDLGPLDQIVVFPDFDLEGRTQDNIIYFDNITFNPQGSSPTFPETAAPAPPVRNPEDVMSLFSGAYANISGTDFFPNWGQTTVVSTIEIEGDETMKYESFNYQGTQIDGSIDVSGMEYLHLDLWTANASAVNVFCISPGPQETGFALPITTGQWNSYNIELAEFAGVDLAELIQMKFDGGDGSQTIFLDNIYFYRNDPIGVNDFSGKSKLFTIYPNPLQAGQNLNLSQHAAVVEVFDLTGKLVASFTDTSSIPTDSFKPGINIISMKGADGSVQIQKLTVY
jgi:hypothetical protein